MCTRQCWASFCTVFALVLAATGVSLPWYGIFIAVEVENPPMSAAVVYEYTWNGRINLTCHSTDKDTSCADFQDAAKQGDKKANVTSWEDLDEPQVEKTLVMTHIIATVGAFLLLVGALFVFFGMCCHPSAKHCNATAVKVLSLLIVTGGMAALIVGGMMFLRLPEAFSQEESCKTMLNVMQVTDTKAKTWCDSFMGAGETNVDLVLTKGKLVTAWFPLEGWWFTLAGAAIALCSLCCVASSRHHRHHHHHASYTYQPIQG